VREQQKVRSGLPRAATQELQAENGLAPAPRSSRPNKSWHGRPRRHALRRTPRTAPVRSALRREQRAQVQVDVAVVLESDESESFDGARRPCTAAGTSNGLKAEIDVPNRSGGGQRQRHRQMFDSRISVRGPCGCRNQQYIRRARRRRETAAHAGPRGQSGCGSRGSISPGRAVYRHAVAIRSTSAEGK